MANRGDTSADKSGHTLADLPIAVVSGLGLALAALFLCVVPLAGNMAGARDYVVFWATGQQLVHHANPYDADAMMRIEHSAGLSAGYGVLYMRNPPWGLPLALPLGLVGVRVGALLWSLALVACLAASVRMIWQMQGRPRSRLHWLGLSFAPALVCLFVGQTALFALLGYVLFVRLHGTRPFLAGISLWLCALKPHLFLPIGVVLVAWVLVSRSYKLAAGAAVGLAASCAATYCMAPTAWRDYIQMMRAPGIAREFVPCLSTALRLWLRPQAMWVEYLPVFLGCAWALDYYWRRRQAWDWSKDGNLPMLVSLLLAPYCWLYDQGLAIPALLHGAYRTRSQGLLAALALASVAIEIELVSGIKIPSAFYLWAAPAWLLWYLLACAYAADLSPASKAAE
ncbi:MAG: glycosyltransferase 87 family protein [Terracidiphilus sp.]|nr:glycosyltransferase 87 family protein [Terracidiphilus sp.]